MFDEGMETKQFMVILTLLMFVFSRTQRFGDWICCLHRVKVEPRIVFVYTRSKEMFP